IPQVPLNQVLLNDRTVIGIDWDLWGRSRPVERAALLDELFALAGDARIRPAEPTAYALEDAATALDDLEHRRVVGKVVLATQGAARVTPRARAAPASAPCRRSCGAARRPARAARGTSAPRAR